MVHAALLLLMLEAVTKDLVFTISLKRSTQNLQLSTSWAGRLHHLLRRYRDGGASAVANQRRGRPSNNRLPDVVRDHAIALVRERYADFGPTFAAEKLAECHHLKVSRETLRSWMRQAGIWMSRAERKRIQQPRHRREHIGELIQIDGSEHRWFEDRAAACTLLVFVDDATSRL